MVYVLDVNGRPLMPTKRHRKVRHLLKDKQAKIIINDLKNITDKDFDKGCADHAYFVAKYNEAVRQANQNNLTHLAEVKDQLKQNNQQAEANGVKIAMNSLYGKQEQKENNEMSFNMFDFLNKLSFTRVSGSNEELKAAEMIKEQVNSFGLNADILDFEVSGYNITKATLTSCDNQYEVSGIKGCKSFKVTAPLYYMETTLDTDKYDIKDKIVLINGLINVPTYKKLLKYGAKAFISFSGDITDTKETSDLDNKELRDVLRKKGIIPGVHMRVNTAIQLVKDNPKELTLEIEQDEFTMTSHNVLCEIQGSKYPEEVIYVTAHYDSVEFSKGAYDNGAGSVLIMKLLKYFKENKPLRTVKFLWCGSEERGLLGSKAYINNLSEESIEKIKEQIEIEKNKSVKTINFGKNNNYLFKVTYIGNKINLDVCHILTDGIGATIFLKGIIYNYLNLKYHNTKHPNYHIYL